MAPQKRTAIIKSSFFIFGFLLLFFINNTDGNLPFI